MQFKAEADIAFQTLFTRFANLRLAVLAERLAWRRTRLVRGLSDGATGP